MLSRYIFGIGSTVGTDLFSNDIIAKVEYPTKTGGSAGQPSTSASDDVSYTYNRQGQVVTMTDQNGSVHTYTMDVLGRLKLDAVTTLGSGVDGAVRALGFNFTALGLPYQQTSYSDSAGTTVVNQVQDAYNGYGQLTGQYQSHSGAVNTGSTPEVIYGYSQPSGANYSRLTSVTYPNGRVLDYVYNSGIDSDISRVSGLSDDSGTDAGNVQSYTYLGLSTIVQELDGNGIELTYIKQSGESNGDAGDQYIGLDRFGRVDDQRWIPTGSPSSPTDRFQYGYDRDSNVLYKNNLVSSTFSELYHANSTISLDNNAAYDNLNRLTGFRRGTLSASGNNGGGTGLDQVPTLNTNANSSQSYTLDAVGNQTSVTTDGSNQSNTVNSQNEEMAFGSNTLTYDNNGNMTTDQHGYTLVFDAWNRLVAVKNSGTTIASYSYDASGNRVQQTESSTTIDFYVSSAGQVLEERQGSTVSGQYVWSLSFVNAPVERDDNSTSGSYGKTSSGLGRRIYFQQDANFNVTALVSSSGSVLERFVDTPYGVMTVLNSSWAATSDSYNNVYTFQGGRYDPVTGMIHFGARDYDPALARWGQDDPWSYVDGANRYQMEGSDSVNETDVFGLEGDAAHHPYPKHLGGAEDQPLADLRSGPHTRAHDVFRNNGFGGPRCSKLENDFGRAKWQQLTEAEQRQFIADSLRAANVSEEWIAASMDDIMAGATPGIVQKGGSGVLPIGVIGGAATILLTSETALGDVTTDSPSFIQAQFRGTLNQLANSKCGCKGSLINDLLNSAASTIHPVQVWTGQSHPWWSYAFGLAGYYLAAKDQYQTIYVPNWNAVADATKAAQDALDKCNKCQK